MVGKNNNEVKREKTTDKVNKYSIRKFKNGIASAAIGALLVGAAANVEVVSAEDGNAEVEVGTQAEPEQSTQLEIWPVEFETEYRETDELPLGEERVVQEGQNGSREDTVQYTYLNGALVGGPEVIDSTIIEEPVNKIIEVGTWSDQLNEEHIDFEIEYVETDELPEGEERVLVEGERGLQRLTRRFYYSDGVPTRSEVIGEPEVLRAPVNRVIEVGTVKVTYSTQLETWPIDFEIEYRQTDELPLGKARVVQEGQKGLREDKARYTYHNGVPVGAPEVLESKILKAPVTRIVEVGTLVEPDAEPAKEVVAAINNLSFDKWDSNFPADVQAVRDAYEGLSEDQKELVTNLRALEVAESRVTLNTVIQEVKDFDLEEKDYTKGTWKELKSAFRAAEDERDNPKASVASLTAANDRLRDALDDLEKFEVQLAIEVRGLNGSRTDDYRVRVTNEAGEQVRGSLDEYGRWFSHAELPIGRYRISLRTPNGTYAVINDTVYQGTEAGSRGSFFIDISKDNLFNNSKLYASFQLVVVQEVAEVIEAIDRLALDDWYKDFPAEVAEARKAYDALDEDLQKLVSNYGKLKIAESRVTLNTLIQEVRGFDLDERDYTRGTWRELEEAFRAAVDERENPKASLASLEAANDRLRDALDDLETKEDAWNALLDRVKDLENRLENAEEANEELEAELARLRAELAALRADQEAAEDRIDELEDRVAELEERVEDLESRPAPTDPTGEKPATDDKEDEDEDDDRPAPADPTDVEVEADDDEDDEDDVVALPSTGVSTSGIGLGIASVLSGLGLAFVGKKRKEDE